jgi:hypothetical protein
LSLKLINLLSFWGEKEVCKWSAAVDARKESKVLQDLVLAEKRCEKKKKAEDGARKKASTTNKRKPSGKENGNIGPRKKKTGNKKNKAETIVAIYGHELYRGEDFEKCGSEWFHERYGNGLKQSVNALVVAEEAPGLGADYILDHAWTVMRT